FARDWSADVCSSDLGLDGFDIVPTVPLAVGEDVRALADHFRPYTALYVGGMGSREHNFYNRLAQRMGYGREAAEIQERYLAGDRSEERRVGRARSRQ